MALNNLTRIGNSGFGTDTSINTTGIVTATSFSGDGSALTGVTAVGSGVVVREEGANVGTAQTITVGTTTPVENTVLGRQILTIGENQTEAITGTKTDTIGGTHTLTSPTAAITYDAGEITVNSITHTAHTHPQNDGNDAGGGTSTSGPEG